MKYISLNHNSQPVNFKTALINGLAPDKGLYFPEKIINLPKKIIDNIKTIDDTELCYEVIKDYIGNDFTEDELIKIIQNTIDFKIPLKKVENSIFSLELFHGPTLAFKDIGAKFFALCMDKIKNDFDSKEITVLVATSGDTGGAVAKGFEGLNGINVCILYPKGRISQVQEKQITTNAENVIAFEVNGNFDDCQKMVKDAFNDIEIKNKITLTSANSINIARWLPQMFYYFLAIKKIENNNQNIFSVPSGNFGNICAGILSKEMGLNIQLFLASTNINKTVPRYLESGIYNPEKTKPTISNAMDVSDPSNFIRIQKIFNYDLQKIKKVIKGYSYNDSETREAIKDVYNSYNYIMDPHSAIGYLGLKSYLKNPRSDVNGIFLSTAHPIKFKEQVENSIGNQISFPSRLKKIMTKKKNTIEIESYNELKDHLLCRVN
ncbi:MAG: threonine synthase [Flavobacteriales bacterium]|jgi:threonine synthase|nr:threonine synthase [Flavobacteriales bacterium]